MSIPLRWITGHQREALIALIIFFVSSISFALGYLANREYNHSPIIIEQCPTSSS